MILWFSHLQLKANNLSKFNCLIDLPFFFYWCLSSPILCLWLDFCKLELKCLCFWLSVSYITSIWSLNFLSWFYIILTPEQMVTCWQLSLIYLSSLKLHCCSCLKVNVESNGKSSCPENKSTFYHKFDMHHKLMEAISIVIM